MVCPRNTAEHISTFTHYEWKDSEEGISTYMASYPYADGALDGIIEKIKTEYPFLKKNLSVTTVTNEGRLSDSKAPRPEMAGVKVEVLGDQPKPIRVTISHEIVKKITEALCLQKKVAEHLSNLTNTEWKIKGGAVVLSESYTNDTLEYEKAVKILQKYYYPAHFREVISKWDRSIVIPIERVKAIAKLIAI